MKTFSTYRPGKHIAHCVTCAAVLLGFLMMRQTQALPLRIDSPLSVAMKRQTSLADCSPCAACYIGSPPFKEHKNGDGDPPSLDAAALARRFVSQTKIGPLDSDVVDIPVLALRILYCRWLN